MSKVKEVAKDWQQWLDDIGVATTAVKPQMIEFAIELLEAVKEEMVSEGGHGCSSHRLIESLIDEIK